MVRELRPHMPHGVARIITIINKLKNNNPELFKIDCVCVRERHRENARWCGGGGHCLFPWALKRWEVETGDAGSRGPGCI